MALTLNIKIMTLMPIVDVLRRFPSVPPETIQVLRPDNNYGGTYRGTAQRWFKAHLCLDTFRLGELIGEKN